MSTTRDLTNNYASFFRGCANLAVYPYTGTFYAIANPSNGKGPFRQVDITTAAIATGILTFVVPVLPALFSVTSALASVAISLAVASMFILYPLALLDDMCNAASSHTQFAR